MKGKAISVLTFEDNWPPNLKYCVCVSYKYWINRYCSMFFMNGIVLKFIRAQHDWLPVHVYVHVHGWIAND